MAKIYHLVKAQEFTTKNVSLLLRQSSYDNLSQMIKEKMNISPLKKNELLLAKRTFEKFATSSNSLCVVNNSDINSFISSTCELYPKDSLKKMPTDENRSNNKLIMSMEEDTSNKTNIVDMKKKNSYISVCKNQHFSIDNFYQGQLENNLRLCTSSSFGSKK